MVKRMSERLEEQGDGQLRLCRLECFAGLHMTY